MADVLYFILFMGAFCFFIGVVIPAAGIVYHKVIRRDGMTVKQILDELNF